MQTLYNNTEGTQNSAYGNGALFTNTIGDYNTANGAYALHIATGTGNVATGYQALRNTGDADYITAIGYHAGYINTTGINNTYIGASADAAAGLFDLSNSTAIGYNAKVTASNQIMLGTVSESVVIPGPKLDVAGDIDFTGSLLNNGTAFVSGATELDGLSDVIVGGAQFTDSLLIGHSTTGTLNAAINNVGVGTGVFNALTTGDNNTASGYQALYSNISGQGNTATGSQALHSNTGGSFNIANGYDALFSNQTGTNNIAHGNRSLYFNTLGSHNSANGYESLEHTTGHGNVAIGYRSGDLNTTGEFNTFLGYSTDNNANNLTKTTAIGCNAIATASNQIMLGTATEKVNIAGDVTVNPIDVSVDVKGIQALDEYVKFTIPYSMTVLKYFCTSHSAMIGDFILADSTTETDKTYYVRMAASNANPYYIFSDLPNGTTLNGGALNDEALTTNGGVQLTLYKGNTYTFISTNTVGHPFIVGDSHTVTTGIKLESTGNGAVTASTYRDPYPLHVNGTANIERNLNVARTLTVSGPIRQW